RTSPYSFQGLGLPGLKILAKVREKYGFGIVTEAIDNESLDLVEEWADVIQIGARNMQNFSLLKRAGRARKPVLLKRGMSATLEEFLMAAQYAGPGGRSRSEETQPSAYLCGPQPRHWQAPQGLAALARRDRSGSGWPAGRSASSAGKGAVRRNAVDPARGICGIARRSSSDRHRRSPAGELAWRAHV